MTEPQHTVHTLPTVGSGRTPAIHALVAGLRVTGTKVWLADPAERHHDLADQVDRHAPGIDASVALLKSAAALIQERQTSFLAQPDQPAEPTVRVLVDDLSTVLQRPEAAELIERILRTGRKTGVLETVIEEPEGNAFRSHPMLRQMFPQPRPADC